MKASNMIFVGWTLILVGFFLLIVSGFLWALYPTSFANLVNNPVSTLTTSYFLFILNVGISITSVLFVLLGGMIYSSGQIIIRLREEEDEEDERKESAKSTS